jgi:signal transduction histidine kinase
MVQLIASDTRDTRDTHGTHDVRRAREAPHHHVVPEARGTAAEPAVAEADNVALRELRHEIGNALTPALGYANYLLRRLPAWTDERDRRALAAIAGSLRRVGRLIAAPAAAEAASAAAPWCDLRAALAEALSQVPDERYGDLVVHVPPDEPLEGDWAGEHVVQVLANLLDNAVKYSVPGTPISVEVSAPADAVRLIVRDRGIGIPPEDVEAVFRGHRTVEARQTAAGSGIGLPLCRRLVEAMGGRLRAVSRPGEGSAFVLTLPRTSRPEPAAACAAHGLLPAGGDGA